MEVVQPKKSWCRRVLCCCELLCCWNKPVDDFDYSENMSGGRARQKLDDEVFNTRVRNRYTYPELPEPVMTGYSKRLYRNQR